MSDLKGKVAIVTGGARGIGYAIAQGLAQRGANLAIFDLLDENIDEVTGPLASENGVEVMFRKVDVTDSEGVENAIKEVHEKFGSVDVLVNNAGVTRDGLLMRMKEDDWDLVMKVNLKSAFLCTKAVARIMSKQRSGKVINIASVIGLVGNSSQSNYSASKGGMMSFTKSIAKEFASRNICVNAVAPGYIETKMTEKLPEKVQEQMMSVTPLKRFGKPEDVAKAVCFLASPESDYITGQILNVDGGMVM